MFKHFMRSNRMGILETCLGASRQYSNMGEPLDCPIHHVAPYVMVDITVTPNHGIVMCRRCDCALTVKGDPFKAVELWNERVRRKEHATWK